MPVNSGAAGKTLQKSCQKQQKGWPKGQPFVLIWRVRKDCLQLAELEELLPVFVHFLLDLFDHPLVAGLEHVGKAALHLQAIAPRAVVCCASSDRRYNSADPAILQMMADSGARLYFSDCPPGPDGAVPPPHQALTFTVGAGGAMEGTYLSIPD